jgi:hypothetical protein
MTTKPSIGRTVLVPMDPKMNNGADEAPATITRVWSDTCVNVRVIGENHEAPEWRTSVSLHDERPAGDSLHTAWWPPRI